MGRTRWRQARSDLPGSRSAPGRCRARLDAADRAGAGVHVDRHPEARRGLHILCRNASRGITARAWSVATMVETRCSNPRCCWLAAALCSCRIRDGARGCPGGTGCVASQMADGSAWCARTGGACRSGGCSPDHHDRPWGVRALVRGRMRTGADLRMHSLDGARNIRAPNEARGAIRPKSICGVSDGT